MESKIYRVKFGEETAYIHATNLKFAISTAKRLGRHVFHTTRCYVSECYNPDQSQVLQADQVAVLLGDPIPERVTTSDVDICVDIWAQLSAELNSLGVI